MKRIAALSIVASLVAMPSAALAMPESPPSEIAKVGSKPVPSFVVESVRVGSSSWRARIAVRNLSPHTVGVGGEFGLAFFDGARQKRLGQAAGFAVASTVSSSIPRTLKPGAGWSGEIGGKGRVDTYGGVLYARVVFGPFSNLLRGGKSLLWISEHAATITSPAVAS